MSPGASRREGGVVGPGFVCSQNGAARYRAAPLLERSVQSMRLMVDHQSCNPTISLNSLIDRIGLDRLIG